MLDKQVNKEAHLCLLVILVTVFSFYAEYTSAFLP